MSIRGISNILPQSGQKTTDYMNRIEEANEEKINYYVPYSARYLKYSDSLKKSKGLTDAKINLFTKNGSGQITLEYDVPNEEGVTHQRLVIATAELRKGAENQHEILKVMKNMLSQMKEFSKLEPEQFVRYATKMQRLGWSVTNECIDIAQMTKQDPETEIKRTKFTQEERIHITSEDIELDSHKSRLESQFIKQIKLFMVEGYRELYIDPEAVEVKKRREEVIQYVKGTIKPEKKLAQAFENMHLARESKANYIIERVHGNTIGKYLDDLPDKGRIKKEDIETYLQVREEYAKQNFGKNVSQLAAESDKKDKDIVAEDALETFLTELDEKIESQREQKRVKVREFISERILRGEELEDYTSEDIYEEAQIERKERKRQGAEGPEI